MLNTTSAEVPEQLESDVPAIEIGERVEAGESLLAMPPPYSITGGPMATWLDVKEAGELKFHLNVDYCEGYLVGKLANRYDWQQTLDGLRELYEESAEHCGTSQRIPVRFCGLDCLYSPGKTGVGTVVFDHHLVAVSGSVHFGFADVHRMEASEKNAIASWEFKGGYCLGKTPVEVTEDVMRLKMALGFTGRSKLQRIDYALDVLGFSTNDLEALEREGGVNCTACDVALRKRDNRWFRLQYGGDDAPVKLVVYDKRSELREPKNLNKARRYYALFPEFQGIDKGALTRFEWRVKTQALREDRFGLGDVEHLPWQSCRAIEYLMQDWFRLTVPSSASRKRRQKVTPEWETMQKGCWEYAVAPAGERPELPADRRDMTPLTKQMLGCLVSLATFPECGSVREAKKLFDALVEAKLPELDSAFRKKQVAAFAGRKQT